MSFKKKIDMLLEAKKLDRLSVNKIEKVLNVDGTIYKGMKNPDYTPDPELVSEILRKFQIRKEWWDRDWETGTLDMFDKNKISEDTSFNQEKNPEEVYRNIVEGNTEYILIPRSVLQEKYRLVSIEQLEKEKAQSEKNQAQFEVLLSMYRNLVDRIPIGSDVAKANKMKHT